MPDATTRIGLHRQAHAAASHTPKPEAASTPSAGRAQRAAKLKGQTVKQLPPNNALRKKNLTWQAKTATKAASPKPLLGQHGRSSSLSALGSLSGLGGQDKARPLESAQLAAALSKLELAADALPQPLSPSVAQAGLATSSAQLPYDAQLFQELDQLMDELTQMSAELSVNPQKMMEQQLERLLGDLRSASTNNTSTQALEKALQDTPGFMKKDLAVKALNEGLKFSPTLTEQLLPDAPAWSELLKSQDLTPAGKTTLASGYAEGLLQAFQNAPSKQTELAKVLEVDPEFKTFASFALAYKLTEVEKKAAADLELGKINAQAAKNNTTHGDPASKEYAPSVVAHQARYAHEKQMNAERNQRLASSIRDFMDAHMDAKEVVRVIKQASKLQAADGSESPNATKKQDTLNGLKSLLIDKMRSNKTQFQSAMAELKTWVRDLTHRTPRHDSATKQADGLNKTATEVKPDNLSRRAREAYDTTADAFGA